MAKEAPIIIKKKKGGHAGHHGGSWKVAYADFVTAMMAFFMVMWIMGLSDTDKESIQGYFNDPMGFVQNNPRMKISVNPDMGPMAKPKSKAVRYSEETPSEKTAAERLIRQVKSTINASTDAEVRSLGGQLDYQITGEGLLMEFSEKSGAVFFESGSAVVRPSARTLIARVAPLLASTKRKMSVYGHTDAKPFPGSGYDNWDLSTDRAQAVRRALTASGVPISRFLEVTGRAATDLKKKDDPFHFSNRRVSVLLPWSTGRDADADLPQEILDGQTEAAFKTPKNFIPPVRLRPGKGHPPAKKSYWSGH
ncbi:MAG: OmpA family protein [Chthonomonas sp.]|nr:OmpA family protein [Chthonomonas sp.]